jgi:hypothetical protein
MESGGMLSEVIILQHVKQSGLPGIVQTKEQDLSGLLVQA